MSDAEREALRSLLDAETDGGSVVAPVPDPKPVEYRIDETVLDLNEAPEAEWTLCLDFGTAMSKAFACRTDRYATPADLDIRDLDPLDLPLGEADRGAAARGAQGYGDDDSVYAVVSSVWIDDAGLMYAGWDALNRGRAYEYAGEPRKRLDSIKQQISQIFTGHGSAGEHSPEKKLLEPAVNPTDTRLTYQEAITFYLAYLTDLAVTRLAERIGTRYVKRRFTLPWWKDEGQRRWGAELMGRALVRAQIVADTFRGRWKEGIPVSEVSAVLELAAGYEEGLMWLLDRNDRDDAPAAARWGSGLEALAAASARVWTEASVRELTLVVDVGAGTTDLSLFLVVQDGQKGKRKALPVAPCGVAVRQAGDSLDSRLVDELLDSAHVGGNPDVRKRLADGLMLRDVRRMKERLFRTGVVRETLENDETVELTVEQFLASPGVQRFATTIGTAIQDLLDEVHESWYDAAKDKGISLVLTGGGCKLPMIRDLRNRRWMLGGMPIRCRLAKDVPDLVEERFEKEFKDEYPQMAVAMGGALPMLLDERDALREWAGGAPSPGRLERFPTRGA